MSLSDNSRTVPAPALSLDPDAVVEHGCGDSVMVRHSRGILRLDGTAARALGPILRTGEGNQTLEMLEERIHAERDPVAFGQLYYSLLQLQRFGLLWNHLIISGCTVLTVARTSLEQLFDVVPVPREVPLQISRFASLRRADDRIVIDCADSRSRVQVHRPEVLALLARFAPPTSSADLAPQRDLHPDEIDAVTCYLVAAGVLTAEDESPELELWEPHDLIFHQRSRRGGFPDPVGGDYRLFGRQAPEPAVPAGREGHRTKLARPTPATLENDPSLFQVMESRRSIRRYGATAISLDELGHLLFRVGRVRASVPADPGAGRPYSLADRPYPSGGGAHELEIYATVANCTGLERGCYYYDASAHELVRLNTTPEQASALLQDASLATGWEADPQILFTFTSRIKRLAWKYSGIAYATTLKNVGVLYQSFYLVATAMGLAPCALGSGDSGIATSALGLAELIEVPVGEFILGSRAGTEPP